VVRVEPGRKVAPFPSACFCDNPKFMKKLIKDNPKKTRGRPATGKAPLVGVRMPEEFQAEIKAWAKKQQDHPALAPAIRRLVEIGLDATQPVKARRSMPNKLRAAELAAKAIDGIVSPLARPEERAQRRQRLTKGPSEFREDRVDLPKVKPK
jgi:hypothetical protein